MIKTINIKTKSTIKRTGFEKIIFGIIFGIFLAYALSLTVPFLWLIMNSLKDGTDFAIDSALGETLNLPKVWMFRNYYDAFERLSYGNITVFSMMLNSLWYVFAGNIIALLTDACVGYVLSKYKFRCNALIYGVAIACMTLPIIGNTASYYKVISFLGIYDNMIWGTILTSFQSFGFSFLMMHAFYKTVSWDYAEAVFIDGGGPFTAFFKIMLPMAKPLLVALFITRAIATWNNYESALLFFPSYPGIATGLYLISGELERGFMSIYFSALVLVTIPVIILYSLFSDTLMKNFTVGGLKG